jgi:hypothetical protein
VHVAGLSATAAGGFRSRFAEPRSITKTLSRPARTVRRHCAYVHKKQAQERLFFVHVAGLEPATSRV